MRTACRVGNQAPETLSAGVYRGGRRGNAFNLATYDRALQRKKGSKIRPECKGVAKGEVRAIGAVLAASPMNTLRVRGREDARTRENEM